MIEREATRYSEADWPSSRWPNFKFSEMACQETGACVLDSIFMDKVQRLRTTVGPLFVSSGYRSPEHSIEQAKVAAGKPLGTHTLGRAIDLRGAFSAAFAIAAASAEAGFTGIGIKQHGPVEGRFIHLDDLGEGEFVGVRPTVWSYA
tara:strand:- start:245 stop:685 length:441 start_codon:yes stop_codon:yes gene_type:complete